MFLSNGTCVSTWTNESTQTGAKWGENDSLGVTIDFEDLTVDFFRNGSHVHTFQGIVGPVVAMLELTDPNGKAAFTKFNPDENAKARAYR